MRYMLEAAVAYTLVFVFRLVPYKMGSATGGFVARVVGPMLAVSKVGLENLAEAFPDKTPRQHRQILRGVWDNLGRTIAELPNLGRLQDATFLEAWPPPDLRELAEKSGRAQSVTVRGKRNALVGAENFAAMMLHDGPVIVVTAHMGNWEMAPESAALLGMPVSVVYRPLANPYMNRFIAKLRAGKSDIVARDWLGAVGVRMVLEGRGRLGILIDQRQILNSIPVPFFGRPAWTGTSVAKLALRHDAPIYGAWVQREKGTRFRITVTPPIKFPATGTEGERVRIILTRMNALVEAWVRERPDQWLWLHRRWQPPR
jgi:KDO2-lipid IV(A) lauroyltransferase